MSYLDDEYYDDEIAYEADEWFEAQCPECGWEWDPEWSRLCPNCIHMEVLESWVRVSSPEDAVRLYLSLTDHHVIDIRQALTAWSGQTLQEWTWGDDWCGLLRRLRGPQ